MLRSAFDLPMGEEFFLECPVILDANSLEGIGADVRKVELELLLDADGLAVPELIDLAETAGPETEPFGVMAECFIRLDEDRAIAGDGVVRRIG